MLIDAREKTPLSVSKDGRFLLFGTRDGLWSRALDGSGKEAPFVTSGFLEDYGQFSTDGRWVAYASDESGRFQIYVRAFPTADRVVQVSSDGGDFPRWSADGRFLMMAPISTPGPTPLTLLVNWRAPKSTN